MKEDKLHGVRLLGVRTFEAFQSIVQVSIEGKKDPKKHYPYFPKIKARAANEEKEGV
jgi:hypothetical protein